MSSESANAGQWALGTTVRGHAEHPAFHIATFPCFSLYAAGSMAHTLHTTHDDCSTHYFIIASFMPYASSSSSSSSDIAHVIPELAAVEVRCSHLSPAATSCGR